MSKERELLQEIYNDEITMMELPFSTATKLVELLAEPEQEPVAWMYEWTNETGEIVKGVYVGSHKASHLYELANLVPLYTAPPKRESLSDERLRDLSNSIHAHPDFDNVSVWQVFYIARAIEKAHGIGVDDDK